MTHRFIQTHDTGTREVDVLVRFNATPGDSRACPPYPVEIEDLDIEAADGTNSATPDELRDLRRDPGAMMLFKMQAHEWVEEHRGEI